MRQSAQQSLFSGAVQHKPSAAFTAHEVVFISDGVEVAKGSLSDDALDHLPLSPAVRVRLRLTGEYVDSPLTEGPLTYAECREWEEPCGLHECRYRLEDAVERRTKRVVEEEDAYGNAMDQLYGPRLRSGAHFSRSKPNAPGDWCALRVAERVSERAKEDGLAPDELGYMYGMGAKAAERELVEPALESMKSANGPLADFYGERGRQHGFVFEEDYSEVTAREAARAIVPGEVKKGRTALTVGRRRPRKDRWAGTVRRVPDEFVREDGTVVKTVSAPFLNQARANDTIPAQCSDMRAMLAARRAAQKAKEAA